MVYNLSESNSIANQFLWEMRHQEFQQDRMRFRKNMERLGAIMAYEVSKKLHYSKESVTTPLGQSFTMIPTDNVVLITILRAGIPFFQGFIDFYDQADAGFIGAYREEKGETVTVEVDYVSISSVKDRVVILIDPMLATGKSVFQGIQKITKNGAPKHIHIVSLVAAPEGIMNLTNDLSIPHSIWCCAVDQNLNQQFFIVPGLGDAGDLCYGQKF
jgi:uracil phosphoribosyltransferase